jgi:lipopolysaccharide transport system permease protein
MDTIIREAGRAERNYWSDLWHYRELFAILAWRTVTVRYKQTVIGVAWAVVRPFATMLIFTIVFSRLAKLPSDGDVAYPVLVFAGMLPWFRSPAFWARPRAPSWATPISSARSISRASSFRHRR